MINFHVHTEYSPLDGMIKVKDMIDHAKKNDIHTISITDHGALTGLYDLDKLVDQTNKEGYKLNWIAGMEGYESNVMNDGTLEDAKKYYHMTLLVKNQKGYENLCKLYHGNGITKAGARTVGEFSEKFLFEHHEGLILLTGCMSSLTSVMILNNRYNDAKKKIQEYKDVFGDDVYIELMYHGIQSDIKINNALVNIANELGVKVVLTSDSHYLNPEDRRLHGVFLSINSHHAWDFQGDGYHLYTLNDYKNIMKYLPNNLPNDPIIEQDIIGKKCTENGKISIYKKIIPEEEKIDLFNKFIKEGWDKKIKGTKYDNEDTRARLKKEYDVITMKHYTNYFLDVRAYKMRAENDGALVGPSRGSAAGCLISYLIGIIGTNPMAHGLIFERFLNPGRNTSVDIDLDYSPFEIQVDSD